MDKKNVCYGSAKYHWTTSPYDLDTQTPRNTDVLWQARGLVCVEYRRAWQTTWVTADVGGSIQ